MRRKLNTWHGYPLSPLAVKSGFIDYYTVAEVTGQSLMTPTLQRKAQES